MTLLGAGELVDIATTRLGLAIGTHEANPIAVQLLDHGLMEIIKVGVVAMAVVVLFATRHVTRRFEPGRAARMRQIVLLPMKFCVVALAVTGATNLGMASLQIVLSSRG
jgi:Domain of unknown function (DUF5658)